MFVDYEFHKLGETSDLALIQRSKRVSCFYFMSWGLWIMPVPGVLQEPLKMGTSCSDMIL